MESPVVLVARFLRANNYNETLAAFIQEAGLAPDAGSSSRGSLTLEKVLEEKELFDLSLQFEKVTTQDGTISWSLPAPSVPRIIDSLPTKSNVLHVAVNYVQNGDGTTSGVQPVLFATTADRNLHLIHPESPYQLCQWPAPVNDSPVLSCVVVRNRYFITTSMSGRVSLFDWISMRALEERRDHKKYVVKIACIEDDMGARVATAGWDAQVFIYRMHISSSSAEAPSLGEPVASISLSTNPEALLFVPHPDDASPILVLTRKDSTFLYFYALLPTDSAATSADKSTTNFLGKQNLAPQSNAWIAFCPAAIASHPINSSIVAVATSAVPHMKLIVVRLLIPSIPAAYASAPLASRTQALQAQAASAVQDQEVAAILLHCNTMAPQTHYSTPGLAWRPDGSGVWVNGDDGIIRGIELSSGKILSSLSSGHEAGSKIRCLWSGFVDHQGRAAETIVSGGFDRRIVVWTVDKQ